MPPTCRLEVGTESSLDRSKPVKSYLMPLFPGNSSIEVWSLHSCVITERSCQTTVWQQTWGQQCMRPTYRQNHTLLRLSKALPGGGLCRCMPGRHDGDVQRCQLDGVARLGRPPCHCGAPLCGCAFTE